MHPLLIKTVAERVKEQLVQFPEDVRKDVLILFSAHSLPLKVCITLFTYERKLIIETGTFNKQ